MRRNQESSMTTHMLIRLAALTGVLALMIAVFALTAAYLATYPPAS